MEKWLNSLKANATPSIDECVALLGQHIDWLKQLSQTPQDDIWHGEGNVHIHTGMVLETLYQLLEREACHITGETRQALILGALLHDVGKTQCTRSTDIKGVMRIASKDHEHIGQSYLAFKLMTLPLPFSVVWQILALVGEHHMPKLLVVKNQDKGQYLALSRRADLALLYWLEVADMRGRICPDQDAQLQILEEFKLFAMEYGVFGQSYFPTELTPLLEDQSPQARRYIQSTAIADMQSGNIVMAQEALAKGFAHKEQYANLVILCGPSGAGKSSFVAKHYEQYDCVSLDDLRFELNGNQASQKNRGQVMQLAKERLKQSLRAKRNVVWDATSLRSDFRKVVCDLGRDYHALVTIVLFLLPEKALRLGNKNRHRAVDEQVLSKQLSSFQFPKVDEAHELIVVTCKGERLMAIDTTHRFV